jgi:N4-gp56 family major capsid protein
MAIVTTSVLAPQVQQAWNERLLSTPTASHIHLIAAERASHPQKSGSVARFTVYYPLPTAMTPLGNGGETPPPVVPDALNIDATVQFHGQYMIINEQVTLQRQDPEMNKFIELLGRSLRQTEDELTRNVLQSTASAIDCVGGFNGDSPTDITSSDIDDAVSALRGQNAEFFTGPIPGENRFATAPVGSAYLGFTHTDLERKLNDVDGFIKVSQYPNPSTPLPSEWGTAGNVRFFTSSIGSITPTSSNLGHDIYNTFISGRQAYGVVKPEGYGSKFMYRAPQDPLEQNATVGWKMGFACCIFNDAAICNLRSTLV